MKKLALFGILISGVFSQTLGETKGSVTLSLYDRGEETLALVSSPDPGADFINILAVSKSGTHFTVTVPRSGKSSISSAFLPFADSNISTVTVTILQSVEKEQFQHSGM